MLYTGSYAVCISVPDNFEKEYESPRPKNQLSHRDLVSGDGPVTGRRCTSSITGGLGGSQLGSCVNTPEGLSLFLGLDFAAEADWGPA